MADNAALGGLFRGLARGLKRIADQQEREKDRKFRLNLDESRYQRRLADEEKKYQRGRKDTLADKKTARSEKRAAAARKFDREHRQTQIAIETEQRKNDNNPDYRFERWVGGDTKYAPRTPQELTLFKNKIEKSGFKPSEPKEPKKKKSELEIAWREYHALSENEKAAYVDTHYNPPKPTFDSYVYARRAALRSFDPRQGTNPQSPQAPQGTFGPQQPTAATQPGAEQQQLGMPQRMSSGDPRTDFYNDSILRARQEQERAQMEQKLSDQLFQQDVASFDPTGALGMEGLPEMRPDSQPQPMDATQTLAQFTDPETALDPDVNPEAEHIQNLLTKAQRGEASDKEIEEIRAWIQNNQELLNQEQ